MNSDRSSHEQNPGASLPDTTSMGGCMGIVFVCMLILFGFGFWAWLQSPQWFAALVDNRMEAGIRDASLPETEKMELLDIVHNMTDQFRSGQIVWKDLPDIIESISDSEFAPLAFSIFIEATVINPSGLSDVEKQFAHQQLLRLQWAEMQKLIPDEKMETLWRTIGGTQEEAKSIHLKNDLSDDELRTFFESCKTVLDAHDVPPDPFQFDPSDALNKALQPYLEEVADTNTEPAF